MAAMADCSKALQGLSSGPSTTIQELKSLLHQARQHITASSPVPRVEQPAPRVAPQSQWMEQSLPRVPDPNMQTTCSMSTPSSPTPTKPLPRLHSPAPQRHQTSIPPPLSSSNAAPARNTHSQTTAQTTLAAPPAHSMCSHASKIPKPVCITKPAKPRLSHQENKVHKALAVLNNTTGKLLNYRRLLRCPVYHGDLTISSADEFCHLAQGVSNRIRGTDTIRFIRKADIPKDCLKDVTYGCFVCNV